MKLHEFIHNKATWDLTAKYNIFELSALLEHSQIKWKEYMYYHQR